MKFKEWCKENHLLAKDIEEITGISRRVIWSYWQGDRKPTRKREKQLKEMLHIPSGLFDEDD